MSSTMRLVEAFTTTGPVADLVAKLDPTGNIVWAAQLAEGLVGGSRVILMRDLTETWMAVNPASVLEDGGLDLVYTFTRTGDATNALTVNFTVGGTATLGTDYTGVNAATAL